MICRSCVCDLSKQFLAVFVRQCRVGVTYGVCELSKSLDSVFEMSKLWPFDVCDQLSPCLKCG